MKKLDVLRRHCPSCEENFYNGNNSYGINECWHLEDMKLVLGKVIGISWNPPYDYVKSELKPPCWRKKGFVFIKKEKI